MVFYFVVGLNRLFMSGSAGRRFLEGEGPGICPFPEYCGTQPGLIINSRLSSNGEETSEKGRL